MRVASTTTGTVLQLRERLGSSLAAEDIADEVYAVLDEVLVDLDQPAPSPPRRLDAVRCRLPYRLRRPRLVPAASIPDEDCARIAFQLRRVTPQVIARAEHRLGMSLPAEQTARLWRLHDMTPAPDERTGHLRRYAHTLLTLLELAGDDA
ncbi:hypothetical protein [Streptomyces sp. bgisy060]|uniref:hypothetical protein n=1 Tax=Streptomyces sp. bgisy060 TaxID=3413775 RepID=UPI003EBB5905